MEYVSNDPRSKEIRETLFPDYTSWAVVIIHQTKTRLRVKLIYVEESASKEVTETFKKPVSTERIINTLKEKICFISTSLKKVD